MDAADRTAKREFIQANLDDYRRRAGNVRAVADLNMEEEAVTLACCYMAAFANFRYQRLFSGERERFTRFLFEFAGQEQVLSRVSISDIAYWSACPSDYHRYSKKVPSCGKQLVERWRREHSEPAVGDELPLEEFVAWCGDAVGHDAGSDLGNRLLPFTYAGILYSDYRSAGVHEAGAARKLSPRGGVFLAGSSGAHVYYRHGRLHFSIDFILGLLTAAIEGLWGKCVNDLAWPWELSRPHV